MNAKRAKALRRIERKLEANNLAYQDMLRQQIPVPVTTMSMADFNKAHDEFRESVLGTEMEQADAINQEIKIGLLQQNAKHYIGSEVAEAGEYLDRPQYKLSDMNGDMGVICLVKPEPFIPEFKLSSMCGDGGVACRVMPASKDAQ